MDESQKKSRRAIKSTAPFYTRKQLLAETVPLVLFLVMTGIAFVSHPLLPEKIPIHWNAAGAVDNYGSRDLVFLLPGVFLVLLLLLFFFPLMEPFRKNMQDNYWRYYFFKVIFSIFFVVLFFVTLLPNFGYRINIASVIITMVALLFIGIGIAMRNIKQNYMFGIRTPWTLASELSWTKTHRLGSVLFTLLGILMIIGVFLLKPELLFILFLVALGSVIIALFAYSYVIYRK